MKSIHLSLEETSKNVLRLQKGTSLHWRIEVCMGTVIASAEACVSEVAATTEVGIGARVS